MVVSFIRFVFGRDRCIGNTVSDQCLLISESIERFYGSIALVQSSNSNSRHILEISFYFEWFLPQNISLLNFLFRYWKYRFVNTASDSQLLDRIYPTILHSDVINLNVKNLIIDACYLNCHGNGICWWLISMKWMQNSWINRWLMECMMADPWPHNATKLNTRNVKMFYLHFPSELYSLTLLNC